MSKTFIYIGKGNQRFDRKTNENVEIVPTFRGYEFPKGKPVTVTDPVAIAKLSANPDFEEVKEAKGGKSKTDKSDDKDAAGGKGGDQSGATDKPAA